MIYDIKKDIEKLEEAGVVFDEWIDIDDDLYHSLPGISSTWIKELDKTKSPLKTQYAREKMDKEDKKTEPLIVGRAVHKYLLENQDFDKHFVFAPVDKKTDRKWKSFLNQLGEDNREVLRKRDEDMLKGMISSLKRTACNDNINLYYGIILNPKALREKALFTIDKERNVIYKIKVDINVDGIFYDLKSTKNAESKSFMKDVANLRYGLQAAFYLHVARLAKKKAKVFGFLGVEKEAPYQALGIEIQVSDMNLLMSKLPKLLDEYALCVNTGNWYGAGGIDTTTNFENLIVKGSLPTWYRYELEEETEFKGV